MIKLLRTSLVLAGALTLSASLIAQGPPAGAPGAPGGGGGRGPAFGKPTNLKVLPKDISTEDLLKTMNGFRQALGVNCTFCHYVNPDTKRPDFASDANPVKNNARVMMTMTADINAKYLTTLTDRKTTDPVACGTCHRGESHPSVFVPPPAPPRPPAATPPPAGF